MALILSDAAIAVPRNPFDEESDDGGDPSYMDHEGNEHLMEDLPDQSDDPLGEMNDPNIVELFDQYGRLICATDGSGIYPNDDRLRRCGYALFFGEGHPRNGGCPLRGQCQTVPRAELRAVLHCFRTAQRPTLCLCDCLFVVDCLPIHNKE